MKKTFFVSFLGFLSFLVLISIIFFKGFLKKNNEVDKRADYSSKRIVSLLPSCTEIISSLLLVDNLVGVTSNDDFPPKVKKLPKVGSMLLNVEEIVKLKPDLILASSLNDSLSIEKLKSLGFRVISLKLDTLKDIFDSIKLVGKITHRDLQAQKVINDINRRILLLEKKVSYLPFAKRKKVWLELDSNLYTAGGNTFLDSLITIAGGRNVARNLKNWPSVSEEQVIFWNPEVIIVTYPKGREVVLNRKSFKKVDAVKYKRVYYVDPSILSRQGPRVIEGVELLFNLFYPKLYKEDFKRRLN